MPKLLTSAQLAELLQVDRILLWKLRKRGMPYKRLGNKLIRYNLDDVMEWLEKETATTHAERHVQAPASDFNQTAV